MAAFEELETGDPRAVASFAAPVGRTGGPTRWLSPEATHERRIQRNHQPKEFPLIGSSCRTSSPPKPSFLPERAGAIPRELAGIHAGSSRQACSNFELADCQGGMALVAVTRAKTGPPALSTVTITLRCLSFSAIPSAGGGAFLVLPFSGLAVRNAMTSNPLALSP